MKFKPEKFLFVGIDPGLSGALAAVTDSGDFVSVHDAPTLTVKKGGGKKRVYLESEMVKIVEGLMTCYEIRLVGLENQHAMPKQGVTSVFSLGMGFGLWLGILAGCKLPYERIEPGTWKRDMGLVSGSDKNASVVKALQLFPTAPLTLKKHSDRAEAILIAEYLRRRMIKS